MHHRTILCGSSRSMTAHQANPPSFTIQSTDGKARAGLIHTRHGVIATPASLVYTRRGNPLNLTSDLLEKMQPLPQAFQLNALQFLAGPSPATLELHGGGAHGYLALHPDIPVVATQRDPTVYEYGNKPSNDSWAYATIHTGGVMATPSAYVSAVTALRPDLWVTLGDEIPSDARLKRVKVSVDRTIKWLDICLAAPADADGAEGAVSSLASSALALVAGAGIADERTRAAKAVAEKPVAGFALGGFGTGEAPSERPALIQACLAHLPAEKPRLISGMATPVEVLECVAEGLDLFDDSYVWQASTSGYAISFPTAPEPHQPATPVSADQGRDHTKINLWSVTYRQDKGSLVPGCSCYTCTRHSRAYIHHLLQANEMLAEVLLELHNTHHYQTFMARVREAVQQGTLQQYIAWFKALQGANQGLVAPTELASGKRWHAQTESQPAADAGKRQKTAA